MINNNEINKVVQSIAKAANAQRIILFGSFASGKATEYSDVDLMVIAESKRSAL